MPDLRAEPEVRRRLGPLHPDRRRAHRRARCRARCAGPRSSSGTRRSRGRRSRSRIHADGTRRGRARRRERVPAPLGLRRRRPAAAPSPGSSTSRLVRPVLRQGHALGRPGLRGLRHRRRDRARAHAVGRPHARRGKPGDQQGEARRGAGRSRASTGDEVYLVLDGVLGVEVDGERLAEYGPGAMLGERAHLEGGARTSSLVAVTECKVASVHAEQLDPTRSRSSPRGTAEKTRARLTRARPLLRRPRVDAGARRRVRPLRRATPRAWRSPTTARRTDARCSTPAPGMRRATALLDGRRSAARSCSRTCTGTTPTGCPSSEAADRDGARVSLLPPRPARRASPPRTCSRAACRRRTSRSGPTSCAATGASTRVARSTIEVEGFDGHRGRDPAQGRPHLRLSGERRPHPRSPTCPTTARPPSVRATTASAQYHDAAMTLAGARRRPHPRRPAAPRRGRGGGLVRPRGGGLRGRARRGPPARGASCCSTTSPTAPTTRSTRSPRASPATTR